MGIIDAAAGGASSLFVDVLGLGNGIVKPVLTGVLCGAGIGQWQTRRIRLNLAPALAGEGRCIECGFKLDDNTSGHCPECEESIESTTQSGKTLVQQDVCIDTNRDRQ